MQDNLPILYLSVLLLILAIAGAIIFRQVFKTRRLESALTRLQKKFANEKGTALDHYELGSIFLDKKLFAQAIPQFQKALKTDELEGAALAAVHNALGFAYFAQ
jgi:tetratricopeptide (TPR) repeat protein